VAVLVWRPIVAYRGKAQKFTSSSKTCWISAFHPHQPDLIHLRGPFSDVLIPLLLQASCVSAFPIRSYCGKFSQLWRT